MKAFLNSPAISTTNYCTKKTESAAHEPCCFPAWNAYIQTGPALTYQAHSSPMQMVFYTGDHFPAEYRNDAFVTMRGSWNRKPAVGYKVVRIRFDQSGRPEKFEDFLNGFLLDRGEAFLGRPTGLAIMQDGSLLVGDDTNGVIYRVTYGKPR
jgi:glucose/arabinose dehydrogenase